MSQSISLPVQRPAAETAANLAGVVSAISGGSVRPLGGGSVAAAAGALAAALAQMVAGLTAGRPKYAHVAEEMNGAAQHAAALAAELSALVERDAIACDAMARAGKLPKGIGDRASTRYSALQRALIGATEVPLRIAGASAAVAELSANIAERGNTNAVADAAVAAFLAEAVCRAAVLTVRINSISLSDASIGVRVNAEAATFAEVAASGAARALAAAERAC